MMDQTGLLETFKVDHLAVSVFANRSACGRAAAEHVSKLLRQVLACKGSASIALGAAPSQNEFFEALADAAEVDWPKLVAFQIDEYIGVGKDDPRRLCYFMERRLYGRRRPGQVLYINADAGDPQAECCRYAELLHRWPLDIACLGIGESGHIAYNDPHVADFDDSQAVKVVEVDAASRMQQVHDGTATRLEDAIPAALTLTIPTLMRAPYVSCVAPGQIKAEAVARTLTQPIDPRCPATILRRHPHAHLFLDQASASMISRADHASGGGGR